MPGESVDPDPDELAGVTDLFGGLTREELRGAFEDLAARSGASFDADRIEDRIDAALREYYLASVERDEGELLVAGPTSLPRLPDGGDDLPHLVSVEQRSIDPDEVGKATVERLRADAARAVNEGDADRIETLLDVCYDLEAWAPVETDELRHRLDAAR